MARTYNINPQSEVPVAEISESDKKKFPWQVVPVVLVIGAVVAGTAFGVAKLQEHNEDVKITKTWEEFKNVADSMDGESVTEASTEESGTVEHGQMYSSDPMKRVINWDAVHDVNEEVKCWIYIPQTEIDYPVLQSSEWEDNQYYLKHDVYGNSSAAGSIYMPAEVEGFEDKDIHQIIIGHHMRNGSMFSDLVKYKDKSFWEAAPYIYLYYPDRTEKWLIYSPYHTTQADEIYNMPYEAGTVLYKNLLDKIEANKPYDTATNGPSVSAPLLTLTTCDRTSTDNSAGRFVVNAKLVDTTVLQAGTENSITDSSSVISENSQEGVE